MILHPNFRLGIVATPGAIGVSVDVGQQLDQNPAQLIAAAPPIHNIALKTQVYER